MSNSQHWLDKPENLRKLWHIFIFVLILTVVAGLFVDLHPHFEIESWFGFYAVASFVACLVMVLLAKLIALLLKRPENYYYDYNEDQADD